MVQIVHIATWTLNQAAKIIGGEKKWILGQRVGSWRLHPIWCEAVQPGRNQPLTGDPAVSKRWILPSQQQVSRKLGKYAQGHILCTWSHTPYQITQSVPEHMTYTRLHNLQRITHSVPDRTICTRTHNLYQTAQSTADHTPRTRSHNLYLNTQAVPHHKIRSVIKQSLLNHTIRNRSHNPYQTKQSAEDHIIRTRPNNPQIT